MQNLQMFMGKLITADPLPDFTSQLAWQNPFFLQSPQAFKDDGSSHNRTNYDWEHDPTTGFYNFQHKFSSNNLAQDNYNPVLVPFTVATD